MEASLSIASHPQKFHKANIGSAKDFPMLNIVNNLQHSCDLQYNHSLQMFELINLHKQFHPFLKGNLRRVILHFRLHLIFNVMYRI